MVRKYRHHGSSAALGSPPIAYAEGRCVGGSTEINSGLWHRLPDDLADEWRAGVRHRRVHAASPRPVRRARRGLAVASAARRGAAAVVGAARAGRDQARLALGRVPPRLPLRRRRPGREADDGAHAAPPRRRRRRRGAARAAASTRLDRAGDRVVGARALRAGPTADPTSGSPSAPSTSSCAAAPSRRRRCSSAAASGGRHRQRAQAAPHDQGRRPLPAPGRPRRRARCTASPSSRPNLTIGGSASRRGHVALASPTPAPTHAAALDDWEHLSVYYAAIRSDAGGRVRRRARAPRRRSSPTG